MSEEQKHTKDNPFLASIAERYCLNKAGSQKNTQHVVIDLRGSGIHYNVGDSVAVIPVNRPLIVERTLHAMRAKGDEIVTEKNSGKAWNLSEFLANKANLSTLSKKFVTELYNRQTNPYKKTLLENLLHDGHKQLLADYIEVHEVWDALEENQEAIFTPQELAHHFMPLLPRFYSIASSMKSVGDEIHLTIAALKYVSNSHHRTGVCTHFLLEHINPGECKVPIYIQPHHGFTVPENDNVPIIMIGPGTGVAPFRAFMQERMERGAAGKNWLFFGEWHRSHDFFYEEFWNDLESKGKLRLDLAFSRDQEHKIYVQHRMMEKSAELYRWLEEGAYLYVCGDAHHMAKDVDHALHQIIREHHDEEGTKQYIKKLRSEKRYLRDVY